MTVSAPSTEMLLAEVRRLVDVVTPESNGVWARSAALLARQAFEAAVRAKLESYADAIEDAPFRAQLLCLQGVMADSDLAREAHYLWAALSCATHHCGYELAPTSGELLEWLAAVERIVTLLERRSGPKKGESRALHGVAAENE